jgi:hypothetical protein
VIARCPSRGRDLGWNVVVESTKPPAADRGGSRPQGSKEGARSAMRRLILSIGVTLVVAAAGPVRTAHAQREDFKLTPERVQESIEEGVLYLKKQRLADGTWSNLNYPWPGAVTSLCVLSLLTAGVPVTDPTIQDPLKILRTIEPHGVYQISLQTMVFAMAEPEKDLLLIRRNVTMLEDLQIRDGPNKGCWTYIQAKDASRLGAGGDNSNAQFALLALFEAERVGVSSSKQTWTRAKEYWENAQNSDGSWGYVNGDTHGSGSMTCAGIASLVMAAEILETGDAVVEGDNIVCCGARPEQSRIDHALQWLALSFSVKTNPGAFGHELYYLYGLERVGRLTNRRLIGTHDWYREGLEHLLVVQADLAGYWKGHGTGESYEVIGTALALMFVAKGKRPVLATKLAFGEDDKSDQWERHRKDLDHLTNYCAKRWKQEMTWQVIRARGATVDDYNIAPVLYIAGSEKLASLSDADVEALRQYVDAGGFIFAENCCQSRGGEFDVAFRALMARVFPEEDQTTGQLMHQLRNLPPEHSVFTAEEPIPNVELLEFKTQGIDVGCRTSVVYQPGELGCYWELDRPFRKDPFPKAVEDKIRAHRALGINVMAYATNRELKNKLEIPRVQAEDKLIDALDRTLLYVAEVKHGGGSTIAPMALTNLLKQLRVDTGIRVNVEKRELALTQETLFDQHLVYMHGRTGFSFSEGERKQLRAFVDRGGLVFADAICSSQEFAAAFRREMQAVFPETPMKSISPKHEMFTTVFGGFDLSTVTLRDPQRAGDGGPVQAQQLRVPPDLEGIEAAGRFGVIFSKYDLSCALERQNSLECVGYSRDDAAKIGVNVILFSLKGNL